MKENEHPRSFPYVLNGLIDKIDNNEINYQSMKYGNVQVHTSSVTKSDRIKFFIDIIEKISDLIF